MAPAILTPSANTNAITSTPDQIQARIEKARRIKDKLDQKILELRLQLEALTPAKTPDAPAQVEDSPTRMRSLDELLADDSYRGDDTFKPSEADELNHYNAGSRKYDLDRLTSAVSGFEYEVQTLTALLQNGPAQAESLRQSSSAATGLLAPLKNYFGQEARGQARQQLTQLEEKLQGADERLARAQRSLDAARTARSASPLRPDGEYDPSLHDIPEAVLLSRSRQSVSVSFEYVSRTGVQFTIAMPTFEGEQDLSTTLTLRFDDARDAEAFGALLGRDVPVSGLFTGKSIEENILNGYDVENSLVPFALESVEVDGQKRLRLPQAVWERFGKFIQN